MITITVVTITFQAEKVLQRTLDSVLKQTYSQVEHLIIDGASKDRTLAMAEAYSRRSEKRATGHTVCITSESDNGLYDAMNKGIRQATGDYIVFLNAGDCFPDEDTLDMVAASVGDSEDTLPGVLYGDTDIVSDDGSFLRHRRLSPPENLTWRSFCKGMLVCHQAFYARTDIAKGQFYNTDYHYSADVDWCIRVMKEAAKRHLPLRNVHRVIVNYLEGGMTVRNRRASLNERFSVMASHYGYIITIFMHIYFIIRSIEEKF
jgi:glycosyltransferase involved in cell wall biosynthesis